MPNNKVLSGQNIQDISVQNFGSLESVLEFAAKNDLSLTEDLETGTDYDAREIQREPTVTDYFQNNNIKPATGTIHQLEGIEFWRIEIDFVVS